jgi:hypothetical protein
MRSLLIYIVTAVVVVVRSGVAAEPGPRVEGPWEKVADFPSGEMRRFVIGGRGLAWMASNGKIFLYDHEWTILPQLVNSSNELAELAVNDDTVLATRMDGSTYSLDGANSWRRLVTIPPGCTTFLGVGHCFLGKTDRAIWLLEHGKMERIYERPKDVSWLELMTDGQPAVYLVENKQRVKRYAGGSSWVPLSECDAEERVENVQGCRRRTYVNTIPQNSAVSVRRRCEVIERDRKYFLTREELQTASVGPSLLCFFDYLHMELLSGTHWARIPTPPKIASIYCRGADVWAIQQGFVGAYRANVAELLKFAPAE